MIYLDNAATTLPKPRRVLRAVEEALRRGGNAGRGGHAGEEYAGAVFYRCRKALSELFGLDAPERIIFTMNATHALNLAIGSLAKPGMRFLISGYEHNAVRRPLLARRDSMKTTVVTSPLFEPEVLLFKFSEALRRGADAVVCTHVSNVFGYQLPVERLDALCAEYGVPLIIDASQSAGVLPLDCGALRAARFVCMPGHKGLYGPQGTGALLCLGDQTTPLLFGGTGSDSRADGMPSYLPERLEAGTGNLPGIAGLLAGVEFVRRRGPEAILDHERKMIQRLADGLLFTPGLRCFTAPGFFCQAGVLSIEIHELSPEAAAKRLAEAGIAVRAGLHCAPLAHDSAGTGAHGTLRLSPSAFTTPREIDKTLKILRNL